MTERDTHFQGAADLLFERLTPHLAALFGAIDDKDVQEIQKRKCTIKEIITHFTYDVAVHVICVYDETPRDFAREMIEHIPDLTTWPDTSEQ